MLKEWNEEDHPRDNEGKFTFKNGGANDTNIQTKENNFANILYGKVNKKEKENNEYRIKLLNILGDKATKGDILYATTKELEEKINKHESQNKVKGVSTGGAVNVYMSPLQNPEEKQNNQYMTPVEEMYRRRKGYSEIWEGDENFKNALKHLFPEEGKYSNHKNDRGGETMRGITIDTLNDYKKKHPEYKDIDIKNITKDQAARIYYDDYWKKSGADKIKDKDLAYVHFDATVNHGLGNSREFLKQSGGDFDKYIEIRRKFYENLAKDPLQKDFYNGWMNRLDRMQKNRGNLL